jgi:hypothetical protein
MPNELLPTNCCLPGDITVTEIPSGYVIGRALEKSGPGPWWTYIGIAASEAQAVRKARDLAEATHVRAWRHLSGDDYQLLTRD